MARLLGIDYGEKNVGIALSDTDGRAANPHAVLPNDNALFQAILSLAKECNVQTIVLGDSVQLSGDANPIQTRIDALAKALNEKGFGVARIPEHFSSAQVRRDVADNTRRVDAEVAALLLNYYIERTMNEETKEAAMQEMVQEESPEPQEKISIDHFKSVEMKVGRILSAEIIEGADKLLKLTVDVGEKEPRQIVSGIRAYFPEPEALIGVVCPFVTNLAPRMLRGLESNGMILAAHDETGNFSLLKVDEKIAPGTTLS